MAPPVITMLSTNCSRVCALLMPQPALFFTSVFPPPAEPPVPARFAPAIPAAAPPLPDELPPTDPPAAPAGAPAFAPPPPILGEGEEPAVAGPFEAPATIDAEPPCA